MPLCAGAQEFARPDSVDSRLISRLLRAAESPLGDALSSVAWRDGLRSQLDGGSSRKIAVVGRRASQSR